MHRLMVLKLVLVVVPLTSSEPTLVAVKVGFGGLIVCCVTFYPLTLQSIH